MKCRQRRHTDSGCLAHNLKPVTYGNFTGFNHEFVDLLGQAAESAAVQSWMIDTYDHAVVFSPFIDGSHAPQAATNHTEWYTEGLEYRSLIAIYPCDLYGPNNVFPLAGQCSEQNQALFDEATRAGNENWILRDDTGAPLKIPFKCNASGDCPQYAANVTDSGFREFWIDQQLDTLSRGDYRGIFIDDPIPVFRLAVQNGLGSHVQPMTPNEDGRAITQTSWMNAVAAFMSEIGDAFPGYKIWQNHSTWFAPEFSSGAQQQMAKSRLD